MANLSFLIINAINLLGKIYNFFFFKSFRAGLMKNLLFSSRFDF